MGSAPPAEPPREGLWTIHDLAAYLNVPKATIYRWRTDGHGPPGFMVGRALRFRPADVEAWLAERADEPAASA